MGSPLTWPRYGPLTENQPGLSVSICHSPCTPVLPVFSLFAQGRSQWISFYVTQHGKQVVVTVDRKRLESPLIQMPGAFRVIVGVPTHGMRVCQPPKEFRQLLVRHWSNHKVPVIGHQTIRKNRQRNSSDGFGKHSIECFVVLRLFKQCQSRHSSVEHMEAHSSRAFSRTSWHHRSVTKQTHRVKQNNELRPLFASLASNPFLPPLTN